MGGNTGRGEARGCGSGLAQAAARRNNTLSRLEVFYRVRVNGERERVIIMAPGIA